MFRENKFETSFKENAELFNSHFETQCSLISNSKVSPRIQYLTDNRLSCVSFSQYKIAKVIQNLYPNKRHGHSIRILKICGPSIYKPVEIIFNRYFKDGVFLSEWKKGNIVPIHKKGTNKHWKTTVQCCYYLFMGKFLKDNVQSNFLLKINSFLPVILVLNRAILNKSTTIYYAWIYSSFLEGLKVRSDFLDISNVFDKVWHNGIILKLIQNGISGNFLNLLRDFLNERKERVVFYMKKCQCWSTSRFYTWSFLVFNLH